MTDHDPIEADFEGSRVLEQLAEVDEVDAFFDAVDADDFDRARALLRAAGVSGPEIAVVIRKMKASSDP